MRARPPASRKGFKVFPSTEACLIEARAGVFAGCISATANLNADLCQQAWRTGDAAALDAAVTIRKLFDGKPLVSGVKSTLAHIHNDAGLGARRSRRSRRSRPPTRRRANRRLRRRAGETGGVALRDGRLPRSAVLAGPETGTRRR